MAKDIGLDEWLAELARLEQQTPGGDGFSTMEVAKAKGCNEDTARNLIRRGIDAGVIELTTIRRQSMNGAFSKRTGYRLVKAKRTSRNGKP